MADGLDRVFGQMLEVAGRMMGYAEASTGPTYASGSVWTGEPANSERLINVRFDVSEEDGEVSLKVDQAAVVQFEDTLELIRAVWTGAASKGFPNQDWKY